MSIVYFVTPCYNEEQVLPEAVKRLTVRLGNMIESGIASPESRMLFMDNDNRDKTWELVEGYHRENPLVSGVKLVHNRGHQNALLAGLMTARKYAGCTVSLDVDLQDDVGVLGRFVRQFQDDCDVVYDIRSKHEADTFFKRNTALAFHRVMKTPGVDLVYNRADYRLVSRRALDALTDYREASLFLRDIAPFIGFRSDTVTYERHERFAGGSEYPPKKVISFALNGITSFSVRPLKIVANLGMLVSVLSILGLLYTLVSYFTGNTVTSWTAIVCSIRLLGGIRLLCIGVLGGYIGKICNEVKDKPRYLIGEELR